MDGSDLCLGFGAWPDDGRRIPTTGAVRPGHHTWTQGDTYFQTNIGNANTPEMDDSEFSLEDMHGCPAEAILYLSARAPGEAINIALFSPAALRSRKHRNPRHGLAESRVDGVSFRFGKEVLDYPRENFLVNGLLPIPA